MQRKQEIANHTDTGQIFTSMVLGVGPLGPNYNLIIQLRMRANPPPRILWQHSFLKTLSLPLQIRPVTESCRKFSISKWLRVLSQMVVQEGRKGFKNEAKWSHLGSTLELATPCGPEAPKCLNATNIPPPGTPKIYFFWLFGYLFYSIVSPVFPSFLEPVCRYFSASFFEYFGAIFHSVFTCGEKGWPL